MTTYISPLYNQQTPNSLSLSHEHDEVDIYTDILLFPHNNVIQQNQHNANVTDIYIMHYMYIMSTY